ncbi:methyltransferase [Streptomyces kanamyceticus]|uniref:Putative O-methyltransferase n=1 Tax=Streptomyces kanamyceticus TaxID=1967 RepID=Q1EQC2_STRKN|nr:putative O-methyltransferase [Streptomyces kanamyceticus]
MANGGTGAADAGGVTGAGDGADPRQLVQLVFGSMAAQTLRAAARMRVVELIGDKERTAAEVAAEAGARPEGMIRLLRALAGIGVVAERTPGVFAVTPTGALLDSRRPGNVASLVLMMSDPTMLRGWEHLDEVVRTGEPAFDTVFGTDFFGHLREHPEESARFNEAMSQSTGAAAATLPRAFDFTRFATVADVGGGDGTLLSAVLKEHTGLTGIIYDTAEGLAQAPATLERHGLTERCSSVAGDFFQSAPKGADLYLLKSILHDWPDERAVTILSHCRAVLPPEGRVLILEHVLPEAVDPAAPGFAYLSDLNMLVNLGGRERTRADFDELCGRAGLSIVSVTPMGAPNPLSMIEVAAA